VIRILPTLPPNAQRAILDSLTPQERGLAQQQAGYQPSGQASGFPDPAGYTTEPLHRA
jgi:hypothetical protein